MRDSLLAETISLAGHGGDEIEAYLAQPLGEPRCGGVVVIHHMPGYDEGTKEISAQVRGSRLSGDPAEPLQQGGARCCSRRCRGGCPRARRRARRAARRRRRRAACAISSPSSPRMAASPRSATARAAASLFSPPAASSLEAAVDCYGAFVVGTPPEGSPLKVGPIVHLAKDLSCPLLGLFGAEDQYPSPAQVAELEEALKQAGKSYEFHSYEGAGHAFFSTDRPSYRVEAANDGWQRIWAFFGRYLGHRGLKDSPMCTYETRESRASWIGQGPRRLVPDLERHGLLRPPGALPRRAQPEHRLPQARRHGALESRRRAGPVARRANWPMPFSGPSRPLGPGLAPVQPPL